MKQTQVRFLFLGRIGRWASFFRKLIPLAGPYWRSEGKWKIRGMTAALIGLTLLQIVIAASINYWIEHLFNSLESRDIRRFLWLVGAAGLIMVVNIAVTIFHLAVKRWIKIGWRKWLTHRVLGEWMRDGRHYRVTQFPGEHSNPDGRIAEDIRIATDDAIDLAHSLLYAILILVSFTAILWQAAGPLDLQLGGMRIYVPGYMVWIAFLYAALGTVIALRLGLPLIKAQNLRQTTEADFRFGLAHARQNSLQVALLQGEANEDRSLRGMFRSAIRSWNLQTRALVSLFYFTSAWWVLSQVFPILVASPRYLAGAITLGVLMQTAQAFQQMVGALSWPVDNVSAVADWRASVERVLGLYDALAELEKKRRVESVDRIRVEEGAMPLFTLERLCLAESDGTTLLGPFTSTIRPGDRVLIAGDSGVTFKLFRAMAGLWPWGNGRIARPDGESVFFASRRPYLPLRSLRAAVSYPRRPDAFSDSEIAEALTKVGLERHVTEMDSGAHWSELLTEEEQRRLSFARIFLFRPSWLVMYESLDGLTPGVRTAILEVLSRELPDSGIVVFGAAPELETFATRRLTISESGDVAEISAPPG